MSVGRQGNGTVGSVTLAKFHHVQLAATSHLGLASTGPASWLLANTAPAARIKIQDQNGTDVYLDKVTSSAAKVSSLMNCPLQISATCTADQIQSRFSDWQFSPANLSSDLTCVAASHCSISLAEPPLLLAVPGPQFSPLQVSLHCAVP